jgi:hypothetical protein
MLAGCGVFNGEIKPLPSTKYIPISHSSFYIPQSTPFFHFAKPFQNPQNRKKRSLKLFAIKKTYTYIYCYELTQVSSLKTTY